MSEIAMAAFASPVGKSGLFEDTHKLAKFAEHSSIKVILLWHPV